MDCKYLIIVHRVMDQPYVSPALEEVDALQEYDSRCHDAELDDVVRLLRVDREFHRQPTTKMVKYHHQAVYVKDLCTHYLSGNLSEGNFTDQLVRYADGIKNEEERIKTLLRQA